MALLAMAGCVAEPSVAPAGRSGLEASFDGREVGVDVPARITVPSATIAGEHTLLRRGNTITAMETTAERGRVVGRPGGRGLHRRVVIEARQVAGATRLSVEVEPGDEAASRSILEDMMVRLGL